MKNLTIYCVRFGKNPKVFLAIANDNIPLKFLGSYVDILNSILFEEFISKDLLSIIKKICKDTKKEAILNINNSNSTIKEIINYIIGCNVTWKNYSLRTWKNSFTAISDYCQSKNFIIEIDHPIDFKEEMISQIIDEGLLISLEKYNKQNELFKQIRKKVRSSLKKNGKMEKNNN